MNRAANDHGLSDVELVQRAQRGVPEAFAELVSRYQDRVYNTCYRMCHNDADALDLTQATFLKALEGLRSFQRRASFYTWLFRIAVNLTISHRRTQSRRPARSLDQSTDDGRASSPAVADCAPDGSRQAERREMEQRVERALEQLDDGFRTAVILKDVEDMDYATIAEILSVPVGTVKSRIHRGRLMLRELLREERTAVDEA